MALSREEIKKLIEERPRKREIEKGIYHQSRLKFHTETVLTKEGLSSYYDHFIRWIASEEPELLPSDKIARFKQLMQAPLPTNQLTQAININLSRVFEGQDSFYRYDFSDAALESDWNEYRDDEFWPEEGQSAMIDAIDSVWVVDLPKEQEGKYPEPRNMLIPIASVIDIQTSPQGNCYWIIFSIGDKLFVYDDQTIRSYIYKDNTLGKEIGNFAHDLGYCPARMFWSDLLNKDNWINHKAPLTNVLSELDWLLVHKIFKKYMDIANSFPILVMYENEGDSEDFTPSDNKGRTASEQKTLGGAFVGPGTILTAPRPQDGEADMMNNPVKWISPEVDSLKFHVEEDDRLTDYIYKTSVGVEGEEKNDQAKNEKQVLASFESQTIILRRIARNFEKIHSFADKTIIKLRYGVDSINKVSIDYGTKFFLKTTDDLISERDSVKGDDIFSDILSDEIAETKFRNDSGGKLRFDVIRDLDPLPGKSLGEAIQIRNAAGITEEEFKVKVNLINYIRRFEREQMPIAQFVQRENYNKRVTKIKQTLLDYGKKDDSSEPGLDSGDQGK